MMAPEILALCIENDFPILDAFSPLETYTSWIILKVDSEKLKSLGTTSKELFAKIEKVVFNDKRSFLASRLVLIGGDMGICHSFFWPSASSIHVQYAPTLPLKEKGRNWEIVEFNSAYPEDIQRKIIMRCEEMGLSSMTVK
ncbi:hypothetical protein N7533_009906 [Penicillium manginii]|uniref:uncharacterized protein n=1 Tax=Penicillium manginii TaxID=203109 RepID=UPI0025493AA6|nr:uncharacterized protein N7533_009906 [Penicillium manginii]KAJ5745036.1 hypothetical protein N7533_009906 [Penicillium manginii]